jgi:hypothetical protein
LKRNHFSLPEKFMDHPVTTNIHWFLRMNKVFTPLRVMLAAAKIPAGRDYRRMARKPILRN